MSRYDLNLNKKAIASFEVVMMIMVTFAFAFMVADVAPSEGGYYEN